MSIPKSKTNFTNGIRKIMKNSKYILLMHQKGGVGKSTLTLNLAVNFAKAVNVGIVDMDPQGSLTQLSTVIQDLDILTLEGKPEKIQKLQYDYIFIDTPPYLTNNLKYLINLADLIVVPTKAGIMDLMAIQGTMSLIKSQKALDKSLVVLNMIKPNTTLTLDIQTELRKIDKLSLAKTHISDLVSFTRSAFTKGIPENVKAKQQIESLSTEILYRFL